MSALDELLPASFGGVPFHVAEEETRGGRALVVHEYVGRDWWEIQDRGLKPVLGKLTCYVAEIAGVQAQSYALWQACAAGEALLVLPHAGPVLAWAADWQRTFVRDRIGYVAFSVEFVLSGPAPLGVSALLLPARAADAWGVLVAALGEAL